MKLYVHFEGAGADTSSEFTKVLKYDASAADTVAQLLEAFVEAYNKRLSSSDDVPRLRADGLRLLDAKQRLLQPSARVVKCCADLADVFASPCSVQKPAAPAALPSQAPAAASPVSTPSTPAKAAPAPALKAASPPAPPPSAPSSGTADGTAAAPKSASSPPAAAVPAVQHASPALPLSPTRAPASSQPTPGGASTSNRGSACASGSVRALSAAEQQLHATLLRTADDSVKARNYRNGSEIYQQLLSITPRHPTALRGLAALWVEAGQPARGVRWARQAVEGQPTDDALHELLGDCVKGSGRAEEAVKHYKMALEVYSKHAGAAAGPTPAVAARTRWLQLSVARCLYAIPKAAHQETAASAVMALLQQDESDWEPLLTYATIAYDRGLTEDALRVTLRLLVQRPQQHVGVRALLARCLQAPNGVALLLAELAQGENRQAAFAFLATCVKDHGAVAEAVELFREAVRLEPLSAQFNLNLVHSLELQHGMDEALDVVRAYCAISTVQLGGGALLKDVLPCLDGRPLLGISTSTAWLDEEAWVPPPPRPAAAVKTAPGGPEDAAASSMAPPPPPAPAAADLPPLGALALGKVLYNTEQLDVLALLCTAAKILYIGGALPRVARLVEVVEKARQASAKELHTTLIRNEVAYFGCVQQLVQDCPPPAYPPSDGVALKPLFLCGDSHCLPGAWHAVTLRGERRLLFPALVTGCKIWHLRPSSNFYPKVQFLNTVQSLPQGAQVIFMFGEIDCREGLLVATQRCKYESLEEGMEASLDIYMEVLLRLIADRGFEVFVHPIAPVLNETRAVVKPFAAVLARRVRKAAALPQARGRLHYLDFFSRMLSPDGATLSPGLHFDGTHLSPAYIPLLADALAAV